MIHISDHRQWFSYRGLAPHQFMPMLGVHNHVNSDYSKLRRFCYAALNRRLRVALMSANRK